jgi:hypothetical protein
MGAQIKSSKEECALSMRQKGNYAVVTDAQIKLRGEECALSMEQMSRQSNVASKCVQIKRRREECARGMGQKFVNYAVLTNALIKLRGEEYAKDTEHTAILTEESTT